MARLWRDQRKPSAARDLLGSVYSGFTEGFNTFDLKQAKVLLRELEWGAKCLGEPFQALFGRMIFEEPKREESTVRSARTSTFTPKVMLLAPPLVPRRIAEDAGIRSNAKLGAD
jgi:hypothetical protein